MTLIVTFLIEIKDVDASSESGESVQSEPLSLVTWRNPVQQQQAPILYQQLNTSPSVSSSLSSPLLSSSFAPIAPSFSIAPWARPAATESFMTMPRSDYLMLYPGRMPNSLMMQHFAALHAEYLRSLYAINNHHHFG